MICGQRFIINAIILFVAIENDNGKQNDEALK